MRFIIKSIFKNLLHISKELTLTFDREKSHFSYKDHYNKLVDMLDILVIIYLLICLSLKMWINMQYYL